LFLKLLLYLSTNLCGVKSPSELCGISSIIGLQALLIIAVSFTVDLSVRARTLKKRQIQAALADIQDQLKAMSRN